MYEVDYYTAAGPGEGTKYLRVAVDSFNKTTLKRAQELALSQGFDPSRPAHMTSGGGVQKFWAFNNEYVRQLFNGRLYFKINTCNDINRNRIAKVFYLDGSSELIKDPRLPLTVNKHYKSMAGLKKSKAI